MAQRYALSEKTSETDDARIRDVTPLPPPEHLIRFFPIRGTAAERLIGETRQTIRDILHGQDDRLLWSSSARARSTIRPPRWSTPSA